MHTRMFGSTGLEVSRIGFGAAGLSCGARPSTEQAEAALEQLLAAGINFLDTAPTYCEGPSELHHNERLIARVLQRQENRNRVIVATKGGTVRTSAGSWEIDGHPDRLYAEIVASHQALGGGEPIPLWQHHWPDPRYPIAAAMRAARRAVEENLVRHVGVCNYMVEQIQQARDVLEVVSVQNQFNFWRREVESSGVLEYCERENLVFLPWRPLGGPELAGRLAEIPALQAVAAEQGVSVQQIAIAWLLGKSPCVLPIPGSRSAAHVRDCLAAAEVTLDSRQREVLDRLQPSDLAGRKRPAAWDDRPPLASRAGMETDGFDRFSHGPPENC
jgi:aryl-alcohol dehydrogenase-like predicted oxidoreductase